MPKLHAYQRIVAAMREDILKGKFAPGALLPSTREFAASLSSSYTTVNTALNCLVREGWLERLHGSGTYVSRSHQRFAVAGIYHTLDIYSNEEMSFQRFMNDCLVEKLEHMGKSVQIFVDSRPEPLQNKLYPPLARALYHRQVQCLFIPSVNSRSLPLVPTLPVPVAFMSGRRTGGVQFDIESFLRGGLRRLAEQGCRTVGFITAWPRIDSNLKKFVREAKAAGLRTRKEWTLQPVRHQQHLIDYGYHAFRHLWSCKTKPDGLLVYPDTVARGVIAAVLQAGAHVGRKTKFVFHRNAHARILCPFPVTWALSDENAAADALITSIQEQFAGREFRPPPIPFTLEYDDATRWVRKAGSVPWDEN